MSIRVEALRRRLDAVGAVTGASVGTPAQDAYRQALTGLKNAQKKLTADLESKAADHVLLSDRLAIQAAQAEVAQAASALAVENDAIWPSNGSGSSADATIAGDTPPAASRPTDPSRRADRPGPAATGTAGIDVYT